MTVLMIGANGKFAGLVLPELTKRGVTVRALIKDEKDAMGLRQRGVTETVVGDLNNKGSLLQAAKGVDGVFHIGPAFTPNEAELGVSMVDAAKAAGVRKFTFSGAIHPSISKMNNHAAKRPVEEALYESGMNFTVLQPTMFMQTLTGSWKQVVEQGKYGLPYSKQAKVSYVDYRDVAEAAAIALTSNKLDYGTFELSAAGMVDRVEVAQLMSDVLGRTVQAGEPAFDEWAQAAKIPEGPVREGMQKMYADYDRYGFPGGNALVLHAILDREPRTLRAFLSELAHTEQIKKAS